MKIWHLLVVSLAASAWGCGTDSPNSKNTGCSEDAECSANQHCGAENTCVAECGLESTAVCGVGETCGDRGRCVPEGECLENSDCDSPPIGFSCDVDTLVGFAALGTCRTTATGGQCEYAETRVACEFGCDENRCQSDPCVGVFCTEPPAPRCDGANTRVTSSEPGMCMADGSCGYTETRDTCPAGCVNGRCLEGFCDSVVCDSPPASRCDNNIAQFFAPMGTCDDSTGSPVCTYALEFENCGYIKGTCEAAACVSGITQSGEVAIVEVMANPAGFNEALEWFEVLNTTGTDLDMTGWKIVSGGTSADQVHEISMPPAFPAGGRLVFGRRADSAPTVNYVYGDEIDLANTTDFIAFQKADGTWVDYLFYETGAFVDGRSRKFDPSVTPSATANDNYRDWCPSLSDSYTADPMNYGTPGAENTPCVANPCTGWTCEKPADFCADGTKAIQFAADSAMCEETRFNNPYCNFEATEVTCAANELCGSGACREIPANIPNSGEVIFTEVMANPAVVADAEGEWFELYNTTDRELSLFSLIFRDTFTILDYNATIAPNGYVVFIRNTNPVENGGITGALEFTGTLQNTVSATTAPLTLKRQDGVLVDSPYFGNAPSGGRSSQLSLTAYTATANDDTINWCPAGSDAYYAGNGTGDRGTPGAANRQCP